MPSGTVKFFNAAKGYGFIVPSGGGPDIFVHATSVERAGLAEGRRIAFDIKADRRTGRTVAANLTIA